MFQEKNFECEGFDSKWRSEIESRDESLQTTEFSVRDQQTNTKTSTDVQVQTSSNKEVENTNTDMNKLAQWLKSICPMVEKELEDIALTRALKSVHILDEASTVSSHLMQQISLSTNADNGNMFVSGLTWNSTGNTIAISYSFIHDSWCSHLGLIQLYTFDRNDTLPASPNKKLVCAACVTSLHFHPTQPNILCAGTISGEILLWDCQNGTGDGLISSFVCHDDKVTSVRWVSNTDLKKESMVLITTSLDSSLLLWEFNVHDSVLQIKQKYKVDRSIQIFQIDDIYSKRSEKGIVNVDFSPHISGLFILGMESGLVLKCSLLGARQLPNEGSVVPVLDPFVSLYDKHQGEITSISFSPHRKDLFLTCATDDEIRIYHTEQANPVQKIFVELALNCVNWIPYEEKLLVGCGEHGSIKVFSLLNGQHIPNVIATDNQSFTALAINEKRINTVAFGNLKGNIELWFIPWNNIAREDSYKVFKK